MAREFSNRNDILFICDIRTADYKILSYEETEDAVELDQQMQMKWHLLMKPRYSMFKFRLPWGEGTTEYLDGDIFLQIWAPQTSTETRLIVEKNANIKKYDHTKYEEQMFYFNTNTRVKYYNREYLFNVIGLDHCYDCSAEIIVVLQYFLRFVKFDNEYDLWAKINKFIHDMNKHCSPHSHRTLATHITSEKKRQFESKFFDVKNAKIIKVNPNNKRNRGVTHRKKRITTLDPSLRKMLVTN
jgi:cap2 methyltransferase